MPHATSWPSAAPRILLVLVVLLAGLPAVPLAEAQFFINHAMEPRAFGWTFPEGTFPGAEATDAEGDVGIRSSGETVRPPVAQPYGKSQDLRSFRIDEIDGELLRLRIVFTDLDLITAQVENTVFLSSRLDIRFTLGGHDWSIAGLVFPSCERGDAACDDLTAPQILFDGNLADVTADGFELIGKAPSRVLVDQDLLEILVPRWALARSGDALHPMAGDRIDGVAVFTERYRMISMDGEPTFSVVDRLPDSGAIDSFYTLATDSHGSSVKLAQTDGKEVAPVDDGETTFFVDARPLHPRTIVHDAIVGETILLPVWVHNTMDRKALATGAYSVVSEHTGVTIEGPDHFDVPANGVRKLQLTIQAPGPYGPEAPLRIVLQIATVGTQAPQTDRLEVHVRHVPVLSAEAPRLFLHRYGEDDLLSENGVWTFNFKTGVLSTLEQDPAAVATGASMQFCCLVDGTFDYRSRSGLSRDLYLDTDERAVFHLAYEAQVPGSLRLQVTVDHADTLVASGETVFDIAVGTGTFDIPLHVQEDAAALAPSEEGFRLFLAPSFSPAMRFPLGELAAAVDPIPPKMSTQGATWLELPVLPAAPKILDARHLVVDLVNDHDPLRYVNPGKTALWTVTVLNQGAEEDTVTLDAIADRAGWDSAITPGERYRLGPGDSITVGVRVTAPADASEADVAKINVTAASKRLDGATSGLQLTAVATDGLDLEEPAYEADNATVERLSVSERKRDTPAPALAAPLGLMLLALGLARRRRAQ